MNNFDIEEFSKINGNYGKNAFIKDITIRYDSGNFFNKLKKSVEKDRYGEVVFCVIRPSGMIVSITCEEYPDGIFRIPTGGIRPGEDVIKALIREVREELGLDVQILSFPGVLKIKFEYSEDSFMFYSYLFILKEEGGRLLLDATDDEVSEVREVNIDELGNIVDALGNIPGKWGDWGKFRYQTSKAVLEFLKEV